MNDTRRPEVAALEARLGYRFQQPALLEQALTHRSYSVEQAALHNAVATPQDDNEQMEFLGDATLGFLAAEALRRLFPASREGELTRLRASVVGRRHLSTVGSALLLGDALRLGKTAENSSVRENGSLLADAVEAVLAALYLDGGWEAARQFVEQQVLEPALPELRRSLAKQDPFSGAVGDYKSLLQERLQAAGLPGPEYRLLGESGPGHQLRFRMEVWVHLAPDDPGQSLGQAEAASKKAAQQEAARLALDHMDRMAPVPAARTAGGAARTAGGAAASAPKTTAKLSRRSARSGHNSEQKSGQKSGLKGELGDGPHG